MQTPMASAIIAGTKTETRRTRGLDFINQNPDHWELIGKTPEIDLPFDADRINPLLPVWGWRDRKDNSQTFVAQCPYGKTGDILYVRENWAARDAHNQAHLNKPPLVAIEYQATPDERLKFHLTKSVEIVVAPIGEPKKWRPSIHLPKQAARIWLKVISTHPEQLLDITEASAQAEGITFDKDSGYWFAGDAAMASDPVDCYLCLFDDINGDGAAGLNPWVWVIKFEVLSKSGRP